MRAGKLRHLVTIVKANRTADNYGGVTTADATHTTAWADISQINAQERFFGQQIYPTATHRIRVRHADGLQQNMEIKFGTRRFRILAISNLEERNRELEIIAEEAPA